MSVVLLSFCIVKKKVAKKNLPAASFCFVLFLLLPGQWLPQKPKAGFESMSGSSPARSLFNSNKTVVWMGQQNSFGKIR